MNPFINRAQSCKIIWLIHSCNSTENTYSETLNYYYERGISFTLNFSFQWDLTKLRIAQKNYFSLKIIQVLALQDCGGCRRSRQIKLTQINTKKYNNVVYAWREGRYNQTTQCTGKPSSLPFSEPGARCYISKDMLSSHYNLYTPQPFSHTANIQLQLMPLLFAFP